jgi:hypothetical protein
MDEHGRALVATGERVIKVYDLSVQRVVPKVLCEEPGQLDVLRFITSPSFTKNGLSQSRTMALVLGSEAPTATRPTDCWYT